MSKTSLRCVVATIKQLASKMHSTKAGESPYTQGMHVNNVGNNRIFIKNFFPNAKMLMERSSQEWLKLIQIFN